MGRRFVQRMAATTTGLLASLLYAPQLTAFPYRADFGDTVVRSERPLPSRCAVRCAT